MTPTREAAALREIAALLTQADERATSLCQVASAETEELLERVSVTFAADADALLMQANMLDPVPFVPTLFQWHAGKTKEVGR